MTEAMATHCGVVLLNQVTEVMDCFHDKHLPRDQVSSPRRQSIS